MRLGLFDWVLVCTSLLGFSFILLFCKDCLRCVNGPGRSLGYVDLLLGAFCMVSPMVAMQACNAAQRSRGTVVSRRSHVSKEDVLVRCVAQHFQMA